MNNVSTILMLLNKSKDIERIEKELSKVASLPDCELFLVNPDGSRIQIQSDSVIEYVIKETQYE